MLYLDEDEFVPQNIDLSFLINAYLSITGPKIPESAKFGRLPVSPETEISALPDPLFQTLLQTGTRLAYFGEKIRLPCSKEIPLQVSTIITILPDV